MRKRGGNAKKEVDLTEMVQSGPQGAYEALQLYRSRAMRYKSKQEYDEAIKTTSDGTACLLQHGYDNAGAELGELFVELITELERPLTDETRDMIFRIDSKFSQNAFTHRIEFLKSCIKWSVAVGNRELGDPKLHTRLAECMLSSNSSDKKTIAYHFAAGESPLLYCEKLFAQEQLPSLEVRSQQLTLAVVNFLALENLRDANELYAAYRKAEKSLGTRDSDLDNVELLQFVDYLLQTCRRDAAPLFKTLVTAYASKVDFDESIPTLLMGPIALRFFGIKPKVNPMMTMLQSMMS